jgi:hypothetical protein
MEVVEGVLYTWLLYRLPYSRDAVHFLAWVIKINVSKRKYEYRRSEFNSGLTVNH